MIAEVPAGRLAVVRARPRAGDWLEDEVASWRESGLDLIVSLLQADEEIELGLENEAAVCERAGMRFIGFPIADRGVPVANAALSDLVAAIVSELQAGRGVGLHCRMGIGRSASLAVCVLAVLGLPIETTWSAVERARGLPVPDTAAQRAWVADWFTDFTRHPDRA